MVEGDRRFVAACQTCHGAHHIFPASDRRSAVNGANLGATCGGCHPGLSAAVVSGRICRVKGPLPTLLTSYFDIWYFWATGVVVLWLGGVGGALAFAGVLRRRGKRSGDDRTSSGTGGGVS
jgi:hypothetical protein